MTKNDFLSELYRRLSTIPSEDRASSIEYYSEMINDKIEDGIPEPYAVAMLGDIDDIVNQIISDIPLHKLIKEKIAKPRSASVWRIILTSFGFLVIGIPIIACLFTVALSLVIGVWSIAISMFAAVIALTVSGACGIAGFFVLLVLNSPAKAFLLLGTSLTSLGLVLPVFHLAMYCSKLAVLVVKGIILLVKKSFL